MERLLLKYNRAFSMVTDLLWYIHLVKFYCIRNIELHTPFHKAVSSQETESLS